jgi:hypothetical protein
MACPACSLAMRIFLNRPVVGSRNGFAPGDDFADQGHHLCVLAIIVFEDPNQALGMVGASNGDGGPVGFVF